MRMRHRLATAGAIAAAALGTTTAAAAAATQGDFNGDGTRDLAIGIPDEAVNGHVQAGAVEVLYGSLTGVRTAGAQAWTQSSSGVADTPEDNDRFGDALATGDFDGDGIEDL